MNIIHRDLNINNVCLHIPALEPNEEELQNPGKYLRKHHLMRKELMKDLNKIKFEVKIVDYGLSKILKHGEFAGTPAGTPELIAPEVEDMNYD